MVDFFGRQRQARLNTARLLPYLILSVVLTTLAVYGICILTYAVALPIYDFWTSFLGEIASKNTEVRFVDRLWIPALFWSAGGLTLALVVGSSIRKFYRLRQGGWVVAIELGGRRVDPLTQNPDERRLRNVVEEMSIASATPVPDVYVLPRENSINAFAAGHSTADVVIGVTSGALHVLNRDELQGVVAHEFSHILHGDMRMNMRVTGLVHGVYSITLMSYAMMTFDQEREVEREIEDKGVLEFLTALPRGILGFLLAFVGFNGALFGRMIKSSVCREREFLADAAAVQFTRYPDGLAAALKKAESWASERILLPAAEEMSHIFFNNLRDDDQFEWTSTHPPVAERVRRLDPMFNKTIAPPDWKAEARPAKEPTPAKPPQHAIALEQLAHAIAEPALDRAAQMLGAMPRVLLRASRDALGARAIILGLVNANIELDALTAAEVERLRPDIANLDVHLKLPLVELTFPALRGLSPKGYEAFKQTLQRAIESDQQIDLFEFALQKMVSRHLEPYYYPQAKRAVRHLRLKPLAPACSLLLSALAHAGNDSPEAAEKAFRQGSTTLGVPADDLQFMPLADCTLPQMDAALDALLDAAEGIRNMLLNAAVQIISADGLLRVPEAELLRAIADALGCAIPPLTCPQYEEVKQASGE